MLRVGACGPSETNYFVPMKAFFSIILAFAISIGTIEAGPVRTAKNVAKSTCADGQECRPQRGQRHKKSRAHRSLYVYSIGPAILTRLPTCQRARASQAQTMSRTLLQRGSLSDPAFLSNYAPDACQLLRQALIDPDTSLKVSVILPAMPVQSSGSLSGKISALKCRQGRKELFVIRVSHR